MTETARTRKKIFGESADHGTGSAEKKIPSGSATTWAKPKKIADGLPSESGQVRSNPVTARFTGGVNFCRAGQNWTFPDTPSPDPAKSGQTRPMVAEGRSRAKTPRRKVQRASERIFRGADTSGHFRTRHGEEESRSLVACPKVTKSYQMARRTSSSAWPRTALW
jgi:hypothetical protein